LDQERQHHAGRLLPRLTVAEVFVQFLEAVEAETSPENFANRQRWCVEFAKLHGKRPARDVSRLDAQQFKQQMLKATWVRPGQKQAPRPYKPKTINHALETLRRAFSWAIEHELLPQGRNPFSKVKLLYAEGRQRVATEEEYEALMRHCSDDHFRHVLMALRFTAARPGDIRNLKWSMVQWGYHRWYITMHKTMKTARAPKPRIIGMSDVIEEMLRERAARYGAGEYVFLNEDGKPWTRNALGLRMRRLRERAGIRPDAQGEEFVLYTNRHTFLTQAATDPTISEPVLMDLAGHTDPRTTKRYTHLADRVVSEAGRRVADALRGQPTPGK
jgi:integrase